MESASRPKWNSPFCFFLVEKMGLFLPLFFLSHGAQYHIWSHHLAVGTCSIHWDSSQKWSFRRLPGPTSNNPSIWGHNLNCLSGPDLHRPLQLVIGPYTCARIQSTCLKSYLGPALLQNTYTCPFLLNVLSRARPLSIFRPRQDYLTISP